MTIATLEMMEMHQRASALAERAVEFVTDYIAEAAADDLPEVQQQAIYMAGRILAPAHGGVSFKMPPMEEL